MFFVSLCLNLIAQSPTPMPSGMDLLYSEHPAFKATGEPLLAIGVMDGQNNLSFRSTERIQADFWQDDDFRRVSIPAGASIRVDIQRSHPATHSYYLDLEGIPPKETEELATAIDLWRTRSPWPLEVLQAGVSFGEGERHFDNRQLRIVARGENQPDLDTEAARLYQKYGVRVAPKVRLLERPWAELKLFVNDLPVGRPTSFVRFSNAGTIEVSQVEFGRGYAWHGFEDRGYRGEMYAAVDGMGKLAAVNVVGTENILKGVVPSELFATAPLEALKAQAIAARNHLLSRIGHRHAKDPYHLCSNQHCQVYTGTKREQDSSNTAVNETYGEVMYHSGHLVHAVYSSTCGGHTEDNDVAWGEKPDPALRGRSDAVSPRLTHPGRDEKSMHQYIRSENETYCGNHRFSSASKQRWDKSFKKVELQDIVQKHYPKIGEIQRVHIEERGQGGKVKALRLIGSLSEAMVLFELPVRRLFNNLNSGAFIINEEFSPDGSLSALHFRGAGWGHGVGMCQMGAIGRAESGYDYRSILKHYYNLPSLRRLYSENTPQYSAKQ